MRTKRIVSLLIIVIISTLLASMIYYSLYPVGGVKVTLSTVGKNSSELHYKVWTLSPNGSVVVLASGRGNRVEILSSAVEKARKIANALGSSSEIMFIDVWERVGDKVLVLPLMSFELPAEKKWYRAKRINIRIPSPVSEKKGDSAIWKTLRKAVIPLEDPLLIVQKGEKVNVSLMVNLRVNSYSDYVGPKVTVVYANSSTSNVSATRIDVLDSVFSGKYYIGIGAEMKSRGRSWLEEGVYMKTLVIKQEEYICTGSNCKPTGLYRYIVAPLSMKFSGRSPMIIDVWRRDGNGSVWENTSLLRNLIMTPPLGVIMGGIREPVMLYNIYKEPWSSGNMTVYSVGVATPAGYELRKKLSWLPEWFSSVPVVIGNSIAGSLTELEETNETVKVYGAETMFRVHIKTSPTDGSTVTTLPFGYYFYVTSSS